MTTSPKSAPEAASLLHILRRSHDRVFAEMVEAHGRPLTADRSPCAHVVLAVGPFAHGEVAAGRRVGLLFVYETDEGKSEGARGLAPSLDLHAWFTRFFSTLARELSAHVELDPELRLEGGAGPLCNSLDALLAYLERFGGVEERRRLASLVPVAGDVAFGDVVVDELGPFVFRRSLEAALVDALRLIPPERLRVADLVDTMAVGLGGRHAGLKAGTTLQRLDELARLRLLAPEDATRLGALHRQELAGAPAPDESALLRSIVGGLSVLAPASSGPSTQPEVAVALDPTAPPHDRVHALRQLGFSAPEIARERLDVLGRHPDGPFHRRHAAREGSLASALLWALSRSPDPDQALVACDALAHVLRHQSHTGEQLARDPARLQRLAHVFATDLAVTRHLLASPGLFTRLVVEGRSEEPDLGELDQAPPAMKSTVARRLLADHRATRRFAEGTDAGADAALDEHVVTALACGLAGVTRPDELPFLLLRRAAPRFDFDTVLDGEQGRSVPRRLVAALVGDVQIPLESRPGRRPFTLAELERHLALGGALPTWRVLAGPAALVERLEKATVLASAPSL